MAELLARAWSLMTLLRQLIRDDGGQDLIEYALLTGAIGIVGVAAWNAVGGGIGTAYTGWDTGVQNIWEAPNPAGP